MTRGEVFTVVRDVLQLDIRLITQVMVIGFLAEVVPEQE